MVSGSQQTENPPVGGGKDQDDDDDLIGNRLRRARQLRGSRLKDVADRAGLSESYLSQLERGRTRGSIAALKRLTQALGMTMAELFEPDLTDRPRLVRHAERRYLEIGVNARKAMLTSRPLDHLEVFVGHLDPGGSTGADPYAHGDSEELLLVVHGRVVVELDGERFSLESGDSIFYRSALPHRVSNPNDAPAQVLWAISPPSY
jgi:transcriptional regulator with XRE-family HTH domain